MSTAIPDSWTEVFLLGITREGGSEVQFAGLTEDITGLDFGEKDIEAAVLANGGRIVRPVPMTMESMTLKVYPVDANLSGDGVVQHFHPQTSDDTTDPIVVKNTVTRKKHKVVLLWSTTLPAAASTVPATGEPSYRIQVINAYMTKYTPSFDGKQWSAEIMFKWAPFNKDATENKREESCGTATPLGTATTSVTSWA